METDRTAGSSTPTRDKNLDYAHSNGITFYPTPVMATLNDKSGSGGQGSGIVNVLAYGDIPGFSPACLCVDETGRQFWRALKDVTLIDARYVPNVGQLRQIASNVTQRI